MFTCRYLYISAPNEECFLWLLYSHFLLAVTVVTFKDLVHPSACPSGGHQSGNEDGEDAASFMASVLLVVEAGRFSLFV